MKRIHETALIGEPPEHRDHWGFTGGSCLLFDGCDIGAYVTVDAGIFRPTTIGARTKLLKHCHIGHDALIGADCELAPGVVIGGQCEIGDGVRVGVNACMRPSVRVGDGARIGAGAVVVKDVPAGEVWAGNPATRLHARCNGFGPEGPPCMGCPNDKTCPIFRSSFETFLEVAGWYEFYEAGEDARLRAAEAMA